MGLPLPVRSSSVSEVFIFKLSSFSALSSFLRTSSLLFFKVLGHLDFWYCFHLLVCVHFEVGFYFKLISILRLSSFFGWSYFLKASSIHDYGPHVWRVQDPQISNGTIWDHKILFLTMLDFVSPEGQIFSNN